MVFLSSQRPTNWEGGKTEPPPNPWGASLFLWDSWVAAVVDYAADSVRQVGTESPFDNYVSSSTTDGRGTRKVNPVIWTICSLDRLHDLHWTLGVRLPTFVWWSVGGSLESDRSLERWSSGYKYIKDQEINRHLWAPSLKLSHRTQISNLVKTEMHKILNGTQNDRNYHFTGQTLDVYLSLVDQSVIGVVKTN